MPCVAEVEVAAVSCNTLKLSYTVSPLPDGNDDTTLQSLVVRYQAILGGSTQSRTVPLNGRATEGVLCISGLASNTGYRITYSVEVNVGIQVSLPSDVPEPIEVSTGRTCDQRQQCQESRRTRTTTASPLVTSCTTPPPPSCPRPTVTTPSTPPPTRTSSTTMTTITAKPTAPAGELVQHLAKHSTACEMLIAIKDYKQLLLREKCDCSLLILLKEGCVKLSICITVTLQIDLEGKRPCFESK